MEAKKRRADAATQNLPNAVMRNDVKAVRALLEKGGDPKKADKVGGESLASIALASGYKEIADILKIY